MNQSKKIELVNELLTRAINLPLRDGNLLDALRKDAEMIIEKIFGEDSKYITTLKTIIFSPMIYPSSAESEIEIWHSGQQKLINLFNTIKRDIELSEDDTFEVKEELDSSSISNDNLSKKIFIVHGHDNELRLDVSRTVEKLQLKPIVLHEKSDDGLTVIEKFEQNSLDCDFAIVLLSPDDIGCSKNIDIAQAQSRARQNVILELGYFIGRIGRKNVMALVKDDPTGPLELPSDYAGVVYTKYDKSEGWKMKLAQRLKSSGYKINLNDLLS